MSALPDSVPVRLLSSREPGMRPDLELTALLYEPQHRLQPDDRPPTLQGADALSPGLIVGHGAGSRAARHADFCLEACRQGFVVLAFDFRGHGNSEGVGDGPLEQDILAAVRFLRVHSGVDRERVCYRGSSMGGFYGLKAQPEAQFAALVLLCPAGEDVILEALQELEEPEPSPVHSLSTPAVSPRDPDHAPTGAATPAPVAPPRWDRCRLQQYFERQDSRRIAELVNCPVLLVHARPDRTVPFAQSLLLTRHLGTDTTLLALEHGSHTSAQHDPAMHAYTIAWLQDRLRNKREHLED